MTEVTRCQLPPNDVYKTASPSDEYRTLTQTGGGWELRDLDGTVVYAIVLGGPSEDAEDPLVGVVAGP